MKNNNLFLFLYIFLVLCCNSKENNSTNAIGAIETSNIEVINPIEKNDLTEEEFMNNVVNLKFIPLKADSNSLIADMTKVIQYEDLFYILDRKYAAIRIFDDKGNFKKNISNIGSGPGQYISLNGFEIDGLKKELIIYSLESMKLIHFSLDGDFISEQKIPFFGNDFILNTTSNNYTFFLNNNPTLEKQNYNLVYINPDNEVFQNYFPFSEKNSYVIDFSGGITEGNNGIVYNNPLSDTIYNCTDKSCDAKYFINFGSLKCPEYVKKNMAKLPELMNYSYVENKVYESKQALIFPYTYHRYTYTGYYNKTSKKIISNRNTPNIPFFIMRPPIGLNTKTNTFFSYISNDFLEIAKNRDPNILEKLRKNNSEFVKVLESLKDDSNPILILYSFK